MGMRKTVEKSSSPSLVSEESFELPTQPMDNIPFANGMSEHDVMVLAGHASFTTTHEFYLAVADDLVKRARAATEQGLRQKLVHFGAGTF
jgi:hypothetical protein